MGLVYLFEGPVSTFYLPPNSQSALSLSPMAIATGLYAKSGELNPWVCKSSFRLYGKELKSKNTLGEQVHKVKQDENELWVCGMNV